MHSRLCYHWRQRDKSPINKLGINASTVGFGGGGTRAFDKGSLSVNLDYQDLCVYDHIYSGRTDFEDPYRMMTGRHNSAIIPMMLRFSRFMAAMIILTFQL